jgi:hypothetical protein
MTFFEIIKEIENYVRIQGDEMRMQIKSLINESILEFSRFHEWERIKEKETITTDDTGYYPLPVGFVSELALLQETNELDKKDYKNYLKESSKTGLWSIFGSDVYVIGTDQDLDLLFLSIKVTKVTDPVTYSDTLVDDSDTSAVITYYWDMIKQWTVWRFLDFLGDKDSAMKEERRLAQKLNALKAKEVRINKTGKTARISVHNR